MSFRKTLRQSVSFPPGGDSDDLECLLPISADGTSFLQKSSGEVFLEKSAFLSALQRRSVPT